MRGRRRAAAAALAVLGLAGGAGAQGPPRAAVRAESTVVVAPGARYRAGWLHRALLGTNYRELWATPMPVGVLDLAAEAGGLRPTERGGGLQTKSLRFRGGDGREYVFRSLDKDQSPGLPPELREGIVERVAQDQVSSFHPAAAMVVARLLDATGIRHARPRIVIVPDDPVLGEFRSTFANTIGTFEERPGRGFDEGPEADGALDVISTEKLFEKMEQRPGVVDARAFLAARLFDVLVGDRDRHRDQWRWARFADGDDAVWEPIPRDRDMAFVRHQGLFLDIARMWYPPMVTFAAEYPGMLGLTWNGREVDRRILTGLDRAVWDSTTAALQRQITDSVIDDALSAMPAPFLPASAATLRAELRARRDHLGDAAARFYALLAGDVDVHGSDNRDVAEVTRNADGTMDVTVGRRPRAGGAPAPYFSRRFDPRDTKEVRLYLHGADDRVVVRGPAGRLTLRVMGGHGDDVLVDSAAAGGAPTRFYDAAGRDTIVSGPATRVDRRDYTPPPIKRAQDPVRDWGRDWRPAPWVGYSPDVGLFLGLGRTLTTYGFRRDPFAARATLQAGYALTANRPRAQFTGELHPENRQAFGTLLARASGIEVIRFYGLGNATPADRPRAFYRVRQTQYRLEPSLAFPLTAHATASLGAAAQYSSTDRDDLTLVGATRPYGSGQFGQVGARAAFELDTRDRAAAPASGVHVATGASVYPAVWDVRRPFVEARATAAAYRRLAAPLEPTLAVRVGGQRLWGRFPFHESAFLGGASTVRGWTEQRFAGRASAYGNAELRVFLTKYFLFLPGDLGAFALADAGRVYAGAADGSASWHSGVGGGLWIAPLKRSNTVSLAVVRGRERTGFYARMGFMF